MSNRIMLVNCRNQEDRPNFPTVKNEIEQQDSELNYFVLL